jgi:hypothetical protein
VALRNWRVGKLIILWAWGALVSVVAYINYPRVPIDRPLTGHLLWIAVLVPPVVLTILSWRWLTARETSNDNVATNTESDAAEKRK